MGATTFLFVSSMPTEAQELSRGLRRRDPELLDRLIEQFHYRLFRYLLYLTGGREAAEDLFQETWIRVIERGHQYDAKWKFEAWLFTIARNLTIDRMRRKSPAPRRCRHLTALSSTANGRRKLIGLWRCHIGGKPSSATQ